MVGRLGVPSLCYACGLLYLAVAALVPIVSSSDRKGGYSLVMSSFVQLNEASPDTTIVSSRVPDAG